MPQRKIPLINHYYYHVFNRGVNKQQIFTDKIDYKRLVSLFKYYKHKNHTAKFSNFLNLSNLLKDEFWSKIEDSDSYIDIISYCLMPNHFHLLIRQNLEGGTSKFLSDIQNSYTRYYNTRHERTGHLFQGQFKSVLIQSDEQLLHVSRYIHLNPYSSGLVKTLEDLDNYKWSSFREYEGKDAYGICQKQSIISSYKLPPDYIKFVHDNADYQKQLEGIKHLTFD
jgi:putative transposase